MSMAATTTLRVRAHTRDALNQLARESSVSAPEMLDRLVAQEQDARLLDQMNAGFAELRGNPAAWADFKAETAMWDAASAEA